MLFRAPDMAIDGHHAHPSGHALISQFAMNQVAHSHVNAYLLADGDLVVM